MQWSARGWMERLVGSAMQWSARVVDCKLGRICYAVEFERGGLQAW